MTKQRCQWVTDDPVYIIYHDYEWGVPQYNDRKLFEMLCLEGAQAGLSWITILKRRENYRQAFDYFNPIKMSKYSNQKIEALLQDKGIIRNRRKVNAFVKNAQSFLQVEQEFEDFSSYIWSFVGGEQIVNYWQTHKQVPAYTTESEQMSKDLKRRGFQFVGPTICYAFMQATGMVNDHTSDCFLSAEK